MQAYQKVNRNLIGDDEMPELEIALRRLSTAPKPASSRLVQDSTSPMGLSPTSSGSYTMPRSANFGSPTRQSSLESHFPYSSKFKYGH